MSVQTQLTRPTIALQSAPETQETVHELELRIARLTRSVVQASLEVLGGSRPLQQLSDWLDPASYERLQLRANLVRSLRQSNPPDHTRPILHRNVSVRSIRICRITESVYEASAVAFESHRARAIALRLERRRGHWRVTALEIG